MKTENAKEMARVKTGHRRSLQLFLALTLVLLTSTISQSDCVNDALANVDQGVFLVMDSGAVYRIINNNGANVAFWLAPAGVVICDQASTSGEVYYAISNQDTNETVLAVRER